jgi:hypothetical protein
MVSDGEGRGMTDTWQDIPTSDRPTGHPSSWEAEAKELRDELAKERATLRLIKSVWLSTVEDNEALRERVAELEAVLEPLLLRLCKWAADNLTDESARDWPRKTLNAPLERARAALQTGLQCDEGTMGGNGS